ncbi:hypothetical protein TNCV_2193391 [Trichonephila clavipes]|nr:hypothetical protein TNCV_2193391 [Trichonephila clavipes]
MSSETPLGLSLIKDPHFTSSSFEDYCKKQNILHISITTGLPGSIGQIEKQISPSLLCCQNFLSTILRNGTLTYPTCKEIPELNFSKKHQDDSI